MLQLAGLKSFYSLTLLLDDHLKKNVSSYYKETNYCKQSLVLDHFWLGKVQKRPKGLGLRVLATKVFTKSRKEGNNAF